jgi:hypothetical protein
MVRSFMPLGGETMENTITLLQCKSLDATLEFYQALGFEVTHDQREPYLYGAVRQGGVDLHFANLRVYGAKESIGACLVFVTKVETYHKAFADGLRRKYGKVPTAGLPRITRFRAEHTRFKVFDPSGNLLIYIDRDEPEAEYGGYDEAKSELARAIENALFLRDTYANDKGAARALDVALKRSETTDPLARALALATRAELAVAMGDSEYANALRLELQQIALSDENRERFRDELQAADELERWIG